MITRRVLIPLLTTGLLLTGCDASEAPQTAAPPTPPASSPASPPSTPTPSDSSSPEVLTGSDCDNEADAVVNGQSTSAASSATAGDDREVDAEVIIDPAGPFGCQAFLVATVDGTTSSNVISGDLQLDFNPPQIRALVNADGAGDPEAFVSVQAGASTEFGALFLLDPVRPVTIAEAEGPAGDLVAFGGSVTHLNGAGCIPGEPGSVVISGAGSQARRYILERVFYRFEGARLVKTGSETLRVSFRRLIDDYPEFSNEPFANCSL